MEKQPKISFRTAQVKMTIKKNEIGTWALTIYRPRCFPAIALYPAIVKLGNFPAKG